MDLNELLKNPEQIKGLIQVLQALLPKEESVGVTEDTPTQASTKPKKSSSKSSSHTIKTRGGQRSRSSDNSTENRFEKMAEFRMHKEDIAVDQALSKFPPVARSREEVEPITVNCRICGKKELVNPSLIFESASRYKCNNCSTQSG